MNEAIPASRTREDLREGTVFKYAADVEGVPTVFRVGDEHPNTPLEYRNLWRSNPSESGPFGPEGEVRILWEPPFEQITINTPTGPVTESPMNTATVGGALPPNPKQAYGDLKVPMHTVPPALQIGAAKAFGEGAIKYGAFNWRNKAVEAMTYVGAIQRHLSAYIDGEDVDPESKTGKLHLEGIAACVGILLDCTYGGFLIDNRPPKGPAPEMTRTPVQK